MNEALTNVLLSLQPGVALDLACGSGRHSLWLRERGWKVTAVDLVPGPHVDVVTDLEALTFDSAPCDLVICWLYWQLSLLPSIAAFVQPCGVAALAGKTTGRFATSIGAYRDAFPGWTELSSGEESDRCWIILRKP